MPFHQHHYHHHHHSAPCSLRRWLFGGPILEAILRMGTRLVAYALSKVNFLFILIRLMAAVLLFYMLPFFATLLIMTALVKKILKAYLETMYPGSEFEIAWPNGLRDALTTIDNTDLFTFMFLGRPEFEMMKRKLSTFLAESKTGTRCIAASILGVKCMATSAEKDPNKYLVTVDYGRFRGKLITEENLPHLISDIASEPIMDGKLWQCYLIPVYGTSREVWLSCYAVILKIHRLLDREDAKLLVKLFSDDMSPINHLRSDSPELKHLVDLVEEEESHEEEAAQQSDQNMRDRRALIMSHMRAWYNTARIHARTTVKFAKFILRIGTKFMELWINHLSIMFYRNNAVQWCLMNCYGAKNEEIEENYGRLSVAWVDDIPHEVINRMAQEMEKRNSDSDRSVSQNIGRKEIIMYCISRALREYLDIITGHIPRSMRAIVIHDHIGKNSPAKMDGRCTPCRRIERASLPIKSSYTLLDGLAKLKIERSKSEDTVLQLLARYCIHFIPSFAIPWIFNPFAQLYPVSIHDLIMEDGHGGHHEYGSKVLYWAPVIANVGISFTMINYDHATRITIMSRKSFIQSSSLLAECFNRAVRSMANELDVRFDRKSPPPSPPITSQVL